MMIVKELIEHLQIHFNPDEPVVVHIWQVDDVLQRAEERELTLTIKMAEQVIRNIDRNIDCDLGVSWTTLDVYTDDYLEEK